MLKNLLLRLKTGTEYLNYGRDIIVGMSDIYINCVEQESINVLDIGCGEGFDLINFKKIITYKNICLYGVDSFDKHINSLAQLGISGYVVDIESEPLPFSDNFFDVVIANQVVEHTKEIFWIFSEISRVLKPGGVAIIGVPNLASLHNRILLLVGEQPTSIEILGPHVRGITKNSFVRFVTVDGYFNILQVKGANFYPFPPKVAKLLSKIFPTLSVSLFFLCQRTEKAGNFIDVLNTRFYETEYFKGKAN